MLDDIGTEISVLSGRVRDARSKHRRYLPPDLKEALGKVASKAEAAGMPVQELPEKLGVSLVTLRKYIDSFREQASVRSKLVPVTLTATPEGRSERLTLVTPSGWRVEDVDLETALALLRVMS